MNSSAARREAVKAYKERKARRGVFAVRCNTTGAVWAGSSPNLEATRNGLWFQLRVGSHFDKSLQTEWSAQGETAFEYEVLEVLDDEVSATAASGLLKEKRRDWAARLGARILL
jgi:hypothetical protein